MNLKDCVKEFCWVFRMCQEGKLPVPDLRVFCPKCGVEIQGDAKIEFTKNGLLCLSCFGGE